MVFVKNCENMFWGVTIDAGKRYSQLVKQGFHVSMAALEVNAKKPSENVQVMLRHESSEYLLCTLHSNLLQQPLDLNFATGEQVSFSLNGSGVVHLTGYLIPEDEEPELDEDFSDSEDEEIPSLVHGAGDDSNVPGAKRKAVALSQTAKKIKLSENAEDEDDEDEDDDSEEEEGFSDDFDDEFEEEEEDEDDYISQKTKKKKIPAKLEKAILTDSEKKKKPDVKSFKQAASPSSEKTPKKEEKSLNSSFSTQASVTPKQEGAKSSTETPSASANEESAKKKKKKKKKKKNKEENLSQNESTASTPSTTPSTTPKTESTPKKRVVAGGTVVEDLKVGHGPEAKPGKMVSVYYVGTLSKTNKRFDSCTEGKPFRFRLNQGEVIKGWDNGVIGMKVGGKRRIIVPASQGYGNVKQGPIPPNSVLVFEVELKAVS